jgi:hypothetical protein
MNRPGRFWVSLHASTPLHCPSISQVHTIGLIATSSACGTLNQRHVVSLQQNLTERSPGLLVVGLRDLLNLHGIVDDQVHELIKTSDLALNADGELLVQPDADRSVLRQLAGILTIDHHRLLRLIDLNSTT